MDIRFVLRLHDNTPSGGRKIVYEYANYLVEKGHNVQIVFVADTPFRHRKWNRLATVKHFWGWLKRRRKQRVISWFTLDTRINISSFFSTRSIDTEDVDAFVAFDYGIALSTAQYSNNLNNCFYLIQHDEKVYYDEKVVREAWQLPIKKIVISSWLLDEVSKYDPNVYLAKNYVNSEDFYVTETINNREPIISLIQHPNPSKGTSLGIEAIEIAKKSVPNLRVIMFGNHQQIENMPNYFTYYRQADIETLRDKIYNKAAIYLLPSYLEGWGLTATEAMSCGAALVSTRNGGVNDFGFDNNTALLSNSGDVNSLAENLIRLLTDENLRIRIAESGNKEVENLTFQNSAQQFEKILLM